MRKFVRPYPREFRSEAVQLVQAGGRKLSEIAEDLGVTSESLRHWVKQQEIDRGERDGLTTVEREELKGLRRENRILREERDTKKSRGLLRQGDRQDPIVMFGFVEREKACHRVAIMCHILGVSTSGYYRWSRSGSCLRSRRDLELTQRIRQVHVASRGTYGSPRVHAELTLGQGIDCGRKRVARLMRAAGLVGIHRRLYHGITRRDPRRPVFPDHVGRDFMPKAPNRLWVADLTQHPTGEGWLYAGVVLDAFSRRVVGWAMGDRPGVGAGFNRRGRRPAPARSAQAVLRERALQGPTPLGAKGQVIVTRTATCPVLVWEISSQEVREEDLAGAGR